jgi:hypothetical protein
MNRGLRTTLVRLLAFCSLMLPGPASWGGRIELPLRIPLEPLGQALSEHLAATPSSRRAVYRDGPCRYLKLGVPKLHAVEGRLRVVGPGTAALGVELLGNCQGAAAWQGLVDFTLVPWLDRAGRLRMRIIDSQLADSSGARAPAAGLIWDLSKRHVHPRLERFSYDIGATREALLALLRTAAPPQQGDALELALAQLQVMEPRVEASSIVVPIAIEVPDAWLAAPPPANPPAQPLTDAELEAFDQALQPWDAFLVYSIKQVALDSADGGLRERLFTLLLDSRYQLAAILSGEARAVGDPVRALFIDAWNELRAILLDGQRAGLPHTSLLRYAAFIEAGDALLALDRAAPGLGVRVSADGLRQLARTLRPGEAGDPLAYAWAVDPELLRLFEVPDIPDAAPAPRRSWLDFFITPAHAQERSLDAWVPKRDELGAYGASIGGLLKKTTATELQRTSLAAPYDGIYRSLVPSTALIESCWRQYVLREGKAHYLRSSADSVGIMQINQRVWRGFYDVKRLRWDTAYNTRAGAQILMRYLKNYAIPYAERSGDIDHVPRAAYAVYNAGPRAVGRFNKAEPHPREQRVDERLWTLYRGFSSGGQADLRTCGVDTAAALQ